jgi:hypothetical protein
MAAVRQSALLRAGQPAPAHRAGRRRRAGGAGAGAPVGDEDACIVARVRLGCFVQFNTCMPAARLERSAAAPRVVCDLVEGLPRRRHARWQARAPAVPAPTRRGAARRPCSRSRRSGRPWRRGTWKPRARRHRRHCTPRPRRRRRRRTPRPLRARRQGTPAPAGARAWPRSRPRDARRAAAPGNPSARQRTPRRAPPPVRPGRAARPGARPATPAARSRRCRPGPTSTR